MEKKEKFHVVEQAYFLFDHFGVFDMATTKRMLEASPSIKKLTSDAELI